MRQNILFPGLVAAALVGAMGLAPVLASALEDFLTIEKAVVVFDRHDRMHVGIDTDGRIVRDGSNGAFGYGIITADGNALTVTTTHKGVLDSEDQNGNKDSPRWHNHFVQLNTDQTTVPGECAPNSALGNARVEVAALTFESPGVVGILGSKIGMAGIPDTFSGEDAFTGNPMPITRGDDPDLAVSFKLHPLFNGPGGTLSNVCVENVSPVTPKVLN
jgi:hypothetical protein